MGKILEVRAPFLLGIVDVIAVPSLTLFFGARLLHFGACAATKAYQEENKRADYFQAAEYMVHYLSRSPTRRSDTSREGQSFTRDIMRLIVDLLTRSSRATSD